MNKSWKSFFYFCTLACLIVFSTVVQHPLGISVVQADEDENKSVLEGYRNSNGQAPPSTESEENNPENQTSDEQPQANQSDAEDILQDQSLFGMFLQLFFALALIIIMIYALIRFIGKRSQSYQSHRTLQNLGGVHVGTNRSVQLVKVGERILVVGVGENIQLLKEISDEEDINKILRDHEKPETQQQITSVFNWVQSKFTNQDKSSNSEVYFKSFLDRELRDVKSSQKKAHAAIKEKEK